MEPSSNRKKWSPREYVLIITEVIGAIALIAVAFVNLKSSGSNAPQPTPPVPIPISLPPPPEGYVWRPNPTTQAPELVEDPSRPPQRPLNVGNTWRYDMNRGKWEEVPDTNTNQTPAAPPMSRRSERSRPRRLATEDAPHYGDS
jgi:hypothetical protein